MCAYVNKGQVLVRLLPPFLILEFVFGVIGNGLALWIFYHMKPWRSSTVFLFNLALADFLLNMALPLRASYYLSGIDWKFGDAFCRISLFMLAMNRGGSVLFLTAVAVDRYLRVVHPHHSLNSMTAGKATCVAALLWIITITLNISLLMETKLVQTNETTKCESFSNQNKYHSVLFFVEFLISLGIITFCTTHTYAHLRKRCMDRHIRRVMLCLALVMVMFTVCFLPCNITRVLIWVRNTQPTDYEGTEALEMTFYITISLTYLNSMLDPVLYYFSSPTFKRTLNEMVTKLMQKRRKKLLEEQRIHINGLFTLDYLLHFKT
ncbi:hydroxycarboxylic acid receptor 3-like [Clupea harengus]|uniref:Hydroxycarboxylic acid receptor 3-like n=1 Tax=Clupea harengus TaxID=7950 RepID=A0A6P3VP04_CLUHA|nr:hydroxycarboxylic acid receptor 3-like [Clupea harengus]